MLRPPAITPIRPPTSKSSFPPRYSEESKNSHKVSRSRVYPSIAESSRASSPLNFQLEKPATVIRFKGPLPSLFKVKPKDLSSSKGVDKKDGQLKIEKNVESKTESARNDEVKTEVAKDDEVKTEVAKDDEVKTEVAVGEKKDGQLKTEKNVESKTESARNDEVKTEVAKDDEVKTEVAVVEKKDEQLKTEKNVESKTESARNDEVKTEMAKDDEVKTEVAVVEKKDEQLKTEKDDESKTEGAMLLWPKTPKLILKPSRGPTYILERHGYSAVFVFIDCFSENDIALQHHTTDVLMEIEAILKKVCQTPQPFDKDRPRMELKRGEWYALFHKEKKKWVRTVLVELIEDKDPKKLKVKFQLVDYGIWIQFNFIGKDDQRLRKFVKVLSPQLRQPQVMGFTASQCYDPVLRHALPLTTLKKMKNCLVQVWVRNRIQANISVIPHLNVIFHNVLMSPASGPLVISRRRTL